MGHDRRTPTPIRGTTRPTKPTTGPIRRPGDRFGPAGSSDEIGDGSDHIFGPGNGAMMDVMLASATATRGGEATDRGGPRGGGTKDGFGPAGTSDEIGQGPTLPGFLGGLDTMIT